MIGVVIPARNEEKIIRKTIDAINNQTLKAKQLIVVDDCSTDDTARIAKELGADVVKFEPFHENWVMNKELARVFNAGINELDKDLEYVTVVGSDEVLPKNHFEYLTKKMKEQNLTIASGKIMKDEKITVPRGSGRIVDWNWWKSIGGKYPINYGFETWLIGKCASEGRIFKVFPEIRSTVQRPTKTNYSNEKYVMRGKAYKALGYYDKFVYMRALSMVMHGKIIATKKMLDGFKSSVELYEPEVRNYYYNLQKKMVRGRT